MTLARRIALFIDPSLRAALRDQASWVDGRRRMGDVIATLKTQKAALVRQLTQQEETSKTLARRYAILEHEWRIANLRPPPSGESPAAVETLVAQASPAVGGEEEA